MTSVFGSQGVAQAIFRTVGTVPPAWGDEVYLEQVLRNVLTNAVRHSASGLPVVVEISANGGWIAIAISNRGQAISQDDQRRLFDAFFRGENPGGHAPGYGLGLYFSRKLVEAQGGHLQVRSPAFPGEPSPGATFTVTLPMAAEESSQ
jgi:signal transduction histidine kinase